jgi:hypothetical protein
MAGLGRQAAQVRQDVPGHGRKARRRSSTPSVQPGEPGPHVGQVPVKADVRRVDRDADVTPAGVCELEPARHDERLKSRDQAPQVLTYAAKAATSSDWLVMAGQ